MQIMLSVASKEPEVLLSTEFLFVTSPAFEAISFLVLPALPSLPRRQLVLGQFSLLINPFIPLFGDFPRNSSFHFPCMSQ
jgi:hypothetical protein